MRWRVSWIALSLAIFGLSATADAAPPDGGSHTEIATRWRSEIAKASLKFNIPGAWIEAVILAESGGQTMLNGGPNTSPKGAIGLMQLMPQTYAEMRQRYGLGSDPYDAADNIMAGTAYLRLAYDAFGYPGLFAAYNAGPDRYGRSLAGEKLPMETKLYLAKLTRLTTDQPVNPPSVFVTLREGADDRSAGETPTIFVPLE
ncbi:MAG: lytic transglycosylase domain-containing protein [Asticcacaulis sp.]|uniref:lytic transglycosylase domain-containing protein n=1 Tax=Asticcacaulis sp. TaxID=1872648 RepID=UPI0039E2CAE3